MADSDMVERVARAMSPVLFGSPDDAVGPATLMERDKLRRYARAAIQAMREPLKELQSKTLATWHNPPGPQFIDAMIDAALSPLPEEGEE